ncbi:UPF0149 family protein [Caldimonas sp. KR1-144]|uniref:UPF0149 family protein n=1 Tax=Caldimonas sp. KR1-144 TaxID=3400911 RepID=UPI003C07CB7B
MSRTSSAPLPLTDAEIGELDDLLAAIPKPREALDVVMLDGYLAGVLAQPAAVPIEAWLPPVLDWNFGDPEGGETAAVPLEPDAPGWHAAKHERLVALLKRHHATLERQMREEGWFDPLIMEPQDDAGQPLGGEAAIAPALAPWVIGFEHALNHFQGLESLRHEDVPDLLACVRRHLPEQDEDEQAETKALQQEHPLKNLDAAIEDLVGNVIELADIARADMLRVETVRRAEPKVGRNDPCPCGSGKKFKQCHGR